MAEASEASTTRPNPLRALVATIGAWPRSRQFALAAVTLLTLGLYRPFARVSEYRMKVESVTLHVKGGAEQVTGAMVRQQQGGLGDALADAAGLDLIG